MLALWTLVSFSQAVRVKEKYQKQLVRHAFSQVQHEPVGLKENLFPLTKHSKVAGGGPNAVTIIDLGQAGNAYGAIGGARTFLWAEPDISSVSLVHRMAVDPVYGNSRIAFDVSTDRGATWYTNVQCYEPLGPGSPYPQAAGRYPQGGIFNPQGNTTPGNAVFHYFIPTLDQSNGDSWGGYAHGVRKLDTLTPYTQHNLTSHGGFRQNVPDAMTITRGGKSWIADPVVIGGIPINYVDTMLLSKGVFNPATQDFDYTQELMYLPSDKYISDTKIAFGPDGLTGFISVISHHDFNFEPDSAFYPILYKTTDGGSTWNGPIPVKVWGPDGLPGVKNYLTNSMINAFFLPPIPPRDSIIYTTAWEHDIVVDMDGNPHIAVAVGISGSEWNIYTTRNYIGMFDIYSDNGGIDWDARWQDSLRTFSVEYPGSTPPSTEYNRPQAATSADGKIVFISWTDTEDPGVTNNISPNIYCKAYNTSNGVQTATRNVTKFTLAYSQAYLAAMSNYVLEDGTDYSIPFVYQDMNVLNTGDPVQFKYIHGFKISKTDLMGIAESQASRHRVSSSFPNPFSGMTQIEINLENSEQVGLVVYDLTGRPVYEQGSRIYGPGSSLLSIDMTSYPAGIYLANVLISNNLYPVKLVVQ